MAIINGVTSGAGAEVDSASKALRATLYDTAGGSLVPSAGIAAPASPSIFPVGGINDGVYRALRVGRSGGMAVNKIAPLVNLNLYTAAIPPGWTAPVTTMTATTATTTGVLLNASAIGTAGSSASLIAFRALNKPQRGMLCARHRIRLTKGGTNGQADWGLFSAIAPGTAVQTNGFVWLYGVDGTLKPTIYFNSAVSVQGTDIAGDITSDLQYYTFDIIADDDSVRFVCQDPVTNEIISDQTLSVALTDGRVGLQPWFHLGARAFVTGAAANVGTATKLYVGDAAAYLLDQDAERPWSYYQAGQGQGGHIGPTTTIAQLANWSNSAAPTSATLSNTAAGYTSLGGQFQFAAVAGAETDYALFAWTVPAGVNLNVTGIAIDTINTGAAVATTSTILSWFMGEASAATLASNSFRQALGFQSFAIGDAIGKLAEPLRLTFQAPFVVPAGRIFHVGLKMPVGTATASQVIRGSVRVEGFFD